MKKVCFERQRLLLNHSIPRLKVRNGSATCLQPRLSAADSTAIFPEHEQFSNIRIVESLPTPSEMIPSTNVSLVFSGLTTILPQMLETPERLISVRFGRSHWQRQLLRAIFQLPNSILKNIWMVVLGPIIRAKRH